MASQAGPLKRPEELAQDQGLLYETLIPRITDSQPTTGDLRETLKAVHNDFRLIDRSTFYWYPRYQRSTRPAGQPH